MAALDVFSASKMGNTLLVNDGKGRFAIVDPATKGLPGESATASWVDFDNDGLLDLYAFPQGLFRQRPDHTFERTGLLAFPSHKYMAAIANWADFDNDGRRDLVACAPREFLVVALVGEAVQDVRRSVRVATGLRSSMSAMANHWLEATASGKPGNAQAIGARVTLETAAGRQTQVVGLNDGAFFSQGHYRLYFGLGRAAAR